jgi:ferredoxin
MKVNVNFDLCASNAVCMSLAPEIFEVRDDGFLDILNENPGPELEQKLRDAINGCPTGAISLGE